MYAVTLHGFWPRELNDHLHDDTASVQLGALICEITRSPVMREKRDVIAARLDITLHCMTARKNKGRIDRWVPGLAVATEAGLIKDPEI